MTDQIYPPTRTDSARPQPTLAQQIAQDEWKAQLNRLLDEYRNYYVLRPVPKDNPRP